VEDSELVSDEDEPEHGWYTSAGGGVKEAGKKVWHFIDEHKLLESD